MHKVEKIKDNYYQYKYRGVNIRRVEPGYWKTEHRYDNKPLGCPTYLAAATLKQLLIFIDEELDFVGPRQPGYYDYQWRK